jgi:hypothetical protein
VTRRAALTVGLAIAILATATAAAGCGGGNRGTSDPTESARAGRTTRVPLCVQGFCSDDPQVAALADQEEQCLTENNLSPQIQAYLLEQRDARTLVESYKVALAICATLFITERRAECLAGSGNGAYDAQTDAGCNRYAAGMANLVNDLWAREHNAPLHAAPLKLGADLLTDGERSRAQSPPPPPPSANPTAPSAQPIGTFPAEKARGPHNAVCRLSADGLAEQQIEQRTGFTRAQVEELASACGE